MSQLRVGRKLTGPAAQYVARAIGLTDSMLYTHQNAFQIFCNAGGLDVVISRISVRMRWSRWQQRLTCDVDSTRWTVSL